MITPLEKYDTQRKLLNVRFTLLMVSTITGRGDQYGSKDACTIENSRVEGGNCRQEDHMETLDEYIT